MAKPFPKCGNMETKHDTADIAAPLPTYVDMESLLALSLSTPTCPEVTLNALPKPLHILSAWRGAGIVV